MAIKRPFVNIRAASALPTAAARPAQMDGAAVATAMMQRLEQLVERGLWRTRLMVLIAVVASALLALGALFMATIDAVDVLGKVISYADLSLSAAARDELRTDAITSLIKTIDGYLLAAIMLIFALGLYELFINRIDVAQRSEAAAKILRIRSIDDLKDRLAKVVLLVLIIEFFYYSLQLSFTSALDLLYLALGIVLIGGAIYLTKDKSALKAALPPRRRRTGAPGKSDARSRQRTNAPRIASAYSVGNERTMLTSFQQGGRRCL